MACGAMTVSTKCKNVAEGGFEGDIVTQFLRAASWLVAVERTWHGGIFWRYFRGKEVIKTFMACGAMTFDENHILSPSNGL
jgi:hypothetical protein